MVEKINSDAWTREAGGGPVFRREAGKVEKKLVDLEELFENLREPIYATDYGVSSSESDNTSFLQEAIDAAPVRGAQIILPRGTIACASALDLEDRRGITIEGQGGITRGADPATILLFTGTGARFLNCRGGAGIILDAFSPQYSNAGFTGNLLDFSLSSESAHCEINRMLLTPAGVGGTATLLELDKCTIFRASHASFTQGAPAVRGQASGGASYSNNINFDFVTFGLHVGPAVMFGGEDWTFNTCVWQQDSANRINCFSTNASTPVHGMTFFSCVTYDNTVPGGTGFTFSGTGIHFVGGLIQGEAGSQAISLNGVDGFSAKTDFNGFVTAIAFDTATCDNISTRGSNWRNVTNRYGSTGNLGNNYDLPGFGSSTDTPIRLPSYTVGTLPNVTTHERGLAYVSDGTSNKRLAISDGTNWRFPDGNVVS